MKKDLTTKLGIGCAVVAAPIYLLGLYAKYIANPVEDMRAKRKEDADAKEEDWKDKDTMKFNSELTASLTRFKKEYSVCTCSKDTEVPKVNLKHVMKLDEKSSVSDVVDEIVAFCKSAPKFEYQENDDKVWYHVPAYASGIYACGTSSKKSIKIDSSRGLRDIKVATNGMGRFIVTNTISPDRYIVSLIQVNTFLNVDVTNYILNAKGFMDIYRDVILRTDCCSTNLLGRDL